MKYILLASLFLIGCDNGMVVDDTAIVGTCYLHRDNKTIAKVDSITKTQNTPYENVSYSVEDGLEGSSNNRPNNDEIENGDSQYNVGFRFKYPKTIDCSEFEAKRSQRIISELKSKISSLDYMQDYILQKLELLESDRLKGYKSGRK